MGKCECYIHSLKQGEKHVLGEARIIKHLGDNDYLAEYNGVRCHAIFNLLVLVGTVKMADRVVREMMGL